ncbi:hypothetical protein SUDANB15_07395 (plasmid) [Streptomyces sp. enrichment culture]
MSELFEAVDALVASRAPLPPAQERRRLRQAHGLTLDEVAAALKVRRATVSGWEAVKKTVEPRGPEREAYARLLNKDAARFHRRDGPGADDRAAPADPRLRARRRWPSAFRAQPRQLGQGPGGLRPVRSPRRAPAPGEPAAFPRPQPRREAVRGGVRLGAADDRRRVHPAAPGRHRREHGLRRRCQRPDCRPRSAHPRQGAGVRPEAARLLAGRPLPRRPAEGEGRQGVGGAGRRPAAQPVHAEGRAPRGPGLVRHAHRRLRRRARLRGPPAGGIRPLRQRPLPGRLVSAAAGRLPGRDGRPRRARGHGAGRLPGGDGRLQEP